jgi:hypothetical protein
MDTEWKAIDKWKNYREKYGDDGQIGLAKWKKWRMFGFTADPEGLLEIELGSIEKPMELQINYRASLGGSIQIGLFTRKGRGDLDPIKGRSMGEMQAMDQDAISQTVVWKNGSVVMPVENKRIVAQIKLCVASIYAWRFKEI